MRLFGNKPKKYQQITNIMLLLTNKIIWLTKILNKLLRTNYIPAYKFNI
jgi:hypothetical protein